MTPVVQVQNLAKQYQPPHGTHALRDISFEINQGEFFSLLGPNGAGKTTLLSILSGLIGPTSGDALIDTHSIVRATRKAKQVIGVVPQEIALYPTISARENLAFWGAMQGLQGKQLRQRIDAVLAIADLTDRANQRVEQFSGGMKRRLNIAVGLIHNPKVVYLDEPTVGIDPQNRRRILDTLKELNRQGLTVLYTTHYMEEAQELSDRIGIVDGGKLQALGTLEQLYHQHSQHQQIVLQLDQAETLETISAELAALPGVSSTTIDNQRLVIRAREAKVVLPQVLVVLQQAQTHIRSLEIQDPNLESVFLQLTGRALRD